MLNITVLAVPNTFQYVNFEPNSLPENNVSDITETEMIDEMFIQEISEYFGLESGKTYCF